MKVGYLGIGNPNTDVVFEVSSDVIKTFSGMKVSRSATYTAHKIHGHTAVPEMTGIDAATVTFDMLLSAYLGVNPQKELDKLEEFMRKGTVCYLVLGEKIFGTWVIKSMPYNIEYVYKDGSITQAKVTITLIENSGTDVVIERSATVASIGTAASTYAEP